MLFLDRKDLFAANGFGDIATIFAVMQVVVWLAARDSQPLKKSTLHPLSVASGNIPRRIAGVHGKLPPQGNPSSAHS
jgi:hypothetical protein